MLSVEIRILNNEPNLAGQSFSLPPINVTYNAASNKIAVHYRSLVSFNPALSNITNRYSFYYRFCQGLAVWRFITTFTLKSLGSKDWFDYPGQVHQKEYVVRLVVNRSEGEDFRREVWTSGCSMQGKLFNHVST